MIQFFRAIVKPTLYLVNQIPYKKERKIMKTRWKIIKDNTNIKIVTLWLLEVMLFRLNPEN